LAGALKFAEPSGHQGGIGTVVDLGTISGEIGALGHNVEAGKDGDALVGHEFHDMAGALFAEEFEGQQGAEGLLGRDHGRAG
jgi:hypothetical protein